MRVCSLTERGCDRCDVRSGAFSCRRYGTYFTLVLTVPVVVVECTLTSPASDEASDGRR